MLGIPYPGDCLSLVLSFFLGKIGPFLHKQPGIKKNSWSIHLFNKHNHTPKSQREIYTTTIQYIYIYVVYDIYVGIYLGYSPKTTQLVPDWKSEKKHPSTFRLPPHSKGATTCSCHVAHRSHSGPARFNPRRQQWRMVTAFETDNLEKKNWYLEPKRGRKTLFWRVEAPKRRTNRF